MINKVFIVFLILIILISLICGNRSKEGYVDYMMANADSVKNIRGVPESERLLILADIYNNVRKHEKLFSVYDEEYKHEDIQQNPNLSIYKNTTAIFKYLKKHDNELIKLTDKHNKYIPSSTVDKLLDGSLIKPLKDDLMKIKNFPGKTMMPKKHTKRKEIINHILQYRAAAKNERDPEVKKDLTKRAEKKTLDLHKKIIEDDPPDDANTPVDDSPRVTQQEIDDRLHFVTLYHIVKTVEYQDNAIKQLYKIAENYLSQKS